MSRFPNSPRLIEGGIVLIDPDTSAVLRIIRGRSLRSPAISTACSGFISGRRPAPTWARDRSAGNRCPS